MTISFRKLILYLPVLVLLLQFNITVKAATDLHLELTVSNLSSPIYLTAPPNDDRLFIVEQGGRIKIHQNGTTLATPFLDISGDIISGGELGLLGLAFHPNYADNGYFYVNYTIDSNTNRYSRITRYTVSSGNPNLADTSSEQLLLQLRQPADNHNGGMLAFGSDGYLYAGFGDGGSSGDPLNNGQNTGNLLGTIIRLDVDGAAPYQIPGDNPFVSDGTKLDEIWAYGVRNPWRFSFDRITGDLYIADVGQFLIEEVNFQPASSTGGENYGWRLKEGSSCFNPSTNCENGVTLVDPISEYGHTSSNCSVTGGYVYRGNCLPEFYGAYFYADFCSHRIWSFNYTNGVKSDSTEYTPDQSLSLISSFGEDSNGELYIIDFSGKIFRIVPSGGSSQCSADCCKGIRGNIENDANETIDISDLVYLVDFMFTNGPDPFCIDEADVTADQLIDISDLVYLVDYMFTGGPDPFDCV